MSKYARVMVTGIMTTIFLTWILVSSLIFQWHCDKYIKAQTNAEEQRHLAMIEKMGKNFEIILPSMAAIFVALCLMLS